MWLTRTLSSVALCAVVASCTAERTREVDGDSGSPSGGAPSSATETTPIPTPTQATHRQRIRAVLRDSTPDAEEVIGLAKAPTAWVRANGRLLVEYGVSYPGFWPEPAVVAGRVLDRRGRVLTQWVVPPVETLRHWPAGREFVGLTWDGARSVLVRAGAVTRLTRVRGAREARRGDIRVGPGWLLDRAAKTVARERLPGCRQDSIRSVRGRVWCLDPKKKHISWSDDAGNTWTRHTLSSSYFEYCDGGTLGADLAVQDDVVVIGLWRADFSFDRGRTWQDVALPLGLVGSGPTPWEANCTEVVPLPDGRLVISYRRVAVATDATNTRFSLVRTPRGTKFAGIHEGVMLAVSRRPYGDRFVSYDGGVTWQPLRVRSLLRHLLSPPG